MEFYDVLNKRYSCRNFQNDKPIDLETLHKVFSAGNVAPTAHNLQECSTYVIQTPKLLEKVNNLTPCCYGAPVILAVTYDKNRVFVYPGKHHHSGVEDASIVATYMMLAATNEGLSSCWINKFDPEQMREALGLPNTEQLVLLLALGYEKKPAGPSIQHYIRKSVYETVIHL